MTVAGLIDQVSAKLKRRRVFIDNIIQDGCYIKWMYRGRLMAVREIPNA